MASDATLLEGDGYRRLLGRTFKVTKCDADSEYTAKVARLQEKFIKPVEMASKNEVDVFPPSENPDGSDELKTSADGDSTNGPETLGTGLSQGDMASIDATIGHASGSGPKEVEDTASASPKANVVDADATQSEVTVPLSVANVTASVSDSATSKDEALLSATDIRAGVLESDGACFSKSKNNEGEPYSKKPLVTESEESELYVSAMPKKINKESPPSGEIDISERADVPIQNEIDDTHGYSSQETLDGETTEQIQNIVGRDDYQDNGDDTDFDMGQFSNFASVTNKIDLVLYSQAEWKGDTERAEQIRQGYSKVMELTSLSAMRRIRGDNYCALRASSFQILSQSLNILRLWGENIQEIINIPQILMQKYRCNWLKKWSFAGRLKVTPKKTAETMKQCLSVFCDEIIASRSFDDDDSARIQHFMQYFNSGHQDEVLLFEAMKLLMLHSAVVFYDARDKGEEIPFYAELLFARDTCNNPEELMKNHLNTVGDTGGLEQIEMFLLGHALNITIRVMRPSQVHEPDFVTFYPDDHISEWDTCNLIAEDDRHYNIIVP